MNVTVNNTPVTTFSGATVRDAVLAWASQVGKQIDLERIVVRDSQGLETALSGPIEEGMSLTVSPVE